MENETYLGITQADVFGAFSPEHKRMSNGMMVAQGLPYKEGSIEEREINNRSLAPAIPQRCPVTNKLMPYKSIAVICDSKDVTAVKYWLDYVHGGGCVSFEKQIDDSKTLIHSDYQCW